MPRVRLAPVARLLALGAILLSVGGCGEDARVVRLFQEAADRQAAQNVALARVADAAARGAHELVAADAAAREASIRLQGEIQTERRRLDEGWRALRSQERDLASARRRDSALTTAVRGTGIVLVALLALALAWFILVPARHDDGQADLLDWIAIELAPVDPGAAISSSPTEPPPAPDEPAALPHVSPLAPPEDQP